MILVCKHGHQVKAQLDWDGWGEHLYTHRPGDDGYENLAKRKPVGLDRESFNRKYFVDLTGCPYCKWIEVENN